AFRRDTSDNQLVVNFAVEVGSPEVLEMLFVMTAADLAAVGPGVLNRWKEEVLADLFHRAMLHLGGDDPTLEIDARLQKRREEVLARLGARDDLHWFGKQLVALPGPYLLATASEKIARELADLRKLGANDAIAVGSYQPESNTVEYTVGT